jgi:DNA-binding NtrC family response regulator
MHLHDHTRKSVADDVAAWSPEQWLDELEFESDVRIAARSRLPVLVSGSPACARTVALAIARQGRSVGRSGKVVMCDATDPDDVAASFGGLGQLADNRNAIFLVREVHALSRAAQNELLKLVEDPVRSPRVIVSSSVSLFDRVRDGRFAVRLFYRLNSIHITSSSRRADESF